MYLYGYADLANSRVAIWLQHLLVSSIHALECSQRQRVQAHCTLLCTQLLRFEARTNR